MRYNNLPDPNKWFSGRETELNRLESASTKADYPTIVVCGTPSIGKSQLALRHAHSNYDNKTYDVVLWMPADTKHTLLESVGTIVEGLKIPAEGAQHDPKLRERALIQWLNKSKGSGPNSEACVKWLVIFDNVSDPSIIEGFLPVLAQGSVVITCRSLETLRNHDNLAQYQYEEIPLHSFTSDAACEFILSSTNTAERKFAMAICEAVGCLPLELDTVCSLIRSNILGHEILDEQRPSLIDDPESPVRLGFRLAFEKLSDDGPRLLLQMVAFLHPDGAPLDLLHEHTKDSMLLDDLDEKENFPYLDYICNPFEDRDTFESARTTLLELGLIQMDAKNAAIKCHHIIRRAAQESMTKEEISQVSTKLVFFLNSAFPQQTNGEPLLSDWAQCTKYVPSTVSVLDACEKHVEDGHEPALLLELVCRVAWYYYEKWRLDSADDLTNRAITIGEKLQKAGNHPGYSKWYVEDMLSYLWNTIGAVGARWPLGDYGLSSFEKVLQMRVQNKREGNAEDDKWVIAALGNVAQSLIAVGRAEEARRTIEELIEREDMSPNLDIYLANLCLAYCTLGRYEEARDQYDRASVCIRKRWSPTDVRMAIILFYLSKIEDGEGNFDKARDALEECLRIRKRVMPRQPETAFTYHRMGVLHKRHGSCEEAKLHLEQAYEILVPLEVHPGAKCRTIIELEAVREKLGEDPSKQLRTSFRKYYQLLDVGDQGRLYKGDSSDRYGDFVPISFR